MTTLYLEPREVPDVFRRAFPHYSGRKFQVRTAESLTLHDNYWSGGTKSDYMGVNLASGEIHSPECSEYGNPFVHPEIPTVRLAPPEWLLTRNPELYQQQAARIAARFDEAARMAEDAFLAELAGLVQTLQDKLAGKADGVAKRLHDTNVSDLREFFEKFRRLNIHSSEQLDGIVEQAEKAVTLNGLFDLGGVSADQFRESPSLRQAVSTRLSAVGAQLDGLMVDRPRRVITRRPKASGDEYPSQYPTPATLPTGNSLCRPLVTAASRPRNKSWDARSNRT